MTDKEFVESVWDHPVCHGVVTRWHVQVFGFESGLTLLSTECTTKKKAWSAAAEFTLARIEEIRQVEGEIAELETVSIQKRCMDHEECLQSRVRILRTISRLTVIRDDLKKGIKQLTRRLFVMS